MDKTKYDHPHYYGGEDNPFEPVKIMKANGWLEGWCLGSALKYMIRAGKKEGENAVKDLNKASWCLKYLADSLEADCKEVQPWQK